MRRSIAWSVVVFALFSGPDLRAAEEATLQAALGRQIVGPTLPLAEVQRFCDTRVPRMKNYATLADWQADADHMRTEVLARVVFRGQAAAWRDAPVKVEWLDTIDGGPGYRIKKLRYEALPGLWIPALLYEPEKLAGKVPVVLNVNGHVGSPGKAYVPKQMRCINQAKRGMLALNVEWLGMGQLGGSGFAHYRMNQLDLCGTSGLAPFYLSMKRGLDVLLSLENADPQRVAVTGLSGGGWQTIVISSLDTRVTLTNPVAGHSSLLTRIYHSKDMGDSEQMPCDLGAVADYAHLGAMMAPRPILFTFNSKDDCCFEAGYALQPLLDAARPIFALYGKPDAVRSHVNDDPGTHNYELDNRQAFYRMVGDFFYPGDTLYSATEIPSQDEVKPAEQLNVAMPAENQDFHTLALAIAKDLPRDAALPGDAPGAAAWQQARRAALRELIRSVDYEVKAIADQTVKTDGLKATAWKLQLGADWTVPAVELVRGTPERTAILLADGGRKSAAADAARLLDSGCRVLAVDPFRFGESKLPSHDDLFALLVSCVGSRPLGIQASQVAAVARWAAGQFPGGPVAVVAVGPRTSLAALVAAALEEKAVGSLELQGSLGSLKEVIEQDWAVNQAPEMFCFGLLEQFDVKHLVAVSAPRHVALRQPSDRAKADLAGLAAWYKLLGAEFDPVE